MASSARKTEVKGGEEAEEHNPCAECPAGCCSFKTINISYRELEDGERYDSMLLDGLGEEGSTDQLLFEDGEVPEMEWYIKEHGDHRALVFHCTHQTEDGMCGEYDRRPDMCRSFECQALQGEMELEEFLEEHGLEHDPVAHEDVELTEVTERVREIIGRAEV